MRATLAFAITFFAASQCYAGADVYVTAAHDFKASVGHAGAGVALKTASPGLYLGVAGEVGGIAANRTGLDYLYEGAGGYTVKQADFSLTPYLFAGYRQWAVYGDPVTKPDSAYAGAGFHIENDSFFVDSRANYYNHDSMWQPFVEVAAKVKHSFFALYYETSIANGPVLGFRCGMTTD